MYVTGRLPLLLGAGAIPVALLATLLGADAAMSWALVAVWIAGCALLLTADVIIAGTPSGIEIHRSVPERVRLGEQTHSELVLTNRSGRVLRLTLRDGWEPTTEAFPSRSRIDIPAGERRRVRQRLRPRRRGVRRSEFVAVRARGPIGLGGRQATIIAPAQLRVLPPFLSRKHLASRVNRLREFDGSASVQVRGQGTEFDSLREYTRGDDVRSIDWRATARARRTMLRTWRPERDRHIVIVLDTGRTSAGRIGDATRLDSAMEAALLLAALADRAGDQVHLLAFDRTVRARVTGARGAALLPALVDVMAPLQPQLIETDWDRLITESRRFSAHPSLVVLLTAADDLAGARNLIGALPAVPRQTRVIVASVGDPEIRSALGSQIESSEQLWDRVSLERAAIESAETDRALRLLGADLVTGDTETLAPAVSDHYLALKRAGKL